MLRSASGVRSPAEDSEIEDRIVNEIVVDAYDKYERHGAWQTHLGDRLPFPFVATEPVAMKKPRQNARGSHASGHAHAGADRDRLIPKQAAPPGPLDTLSD